MGQLLSEPVTQKETSRYESLCLMVGSSCMQGWRVSMEDSHCAILSLPDDPSSSYFAVYDGHGGANIAQHAGKNLHKAILARPEYVREDLPVAIKEGFLDFDHSMMTDEVLRNEMSGTTAICIFLKKGKLFCGNVGDSRAVASVKGAAVKLSHDHKPGLEVEKRRIIAAGGWVELNRVNGNLALSRALGDFDFKKNSNKSAHDQIVTAYPDVMSFNVSSEWEFIVIACDGIWDVLTNEEVIDFVRLRIGKGMEVDEICEDLMSRCLAPDCQMGGLGCDNMSVIIVCLTNSSTWEEFGEKCSLPAEFIEDSDLIDVELSNL